jgi:DNA anti-recombination protein RmuC
MFDAFRKLGNGLNTSVSAFNDVASRLDNSVLGSAKNLRDFGVKINQSLPESIEPVEKSLREIQADPEASHIQELEPKAEE